jgi:hypothetical protein
MMTLNVFTSSGSYFHQKTIVTLFTAVIILTIVIISDVDSDKPALKQLT